MRAAKNVKKEKKSNYGILVWIFIILGVGLRFLLFWYNLPSNSFDNHFEPIALIVKLGIIPAKDACFQCYQPPVFYFISAMVAKLALSIGFDNPQILKILQFVGALYGMLGLVVVYLILKKLPLSNFSRLLALGTVCFLPRHIYMSAMHSNDTLSYLAVALCVYLVLIAIERKLSYPYLVLLSISAAVAIFTKYTSFVILPALLAVFTTNFIWNIVATRKKTLISAIIVFLIPLSLVGAYTSSNIKNYDKALPWNDNMINTDLTQPHAQKGVSFTNIKPWKTISAPIITPDNIDSFWTLIYSRMWFDMEPKFLYYTDQDESWWNRYYSWLRGEAPFPSDNNPLSTFTLLSGAGLITLGLVPLFLTVIGGIISVYRWWEHRSHSMEFLTIPLFLMLLVFNAVGILALGLKAPVYSSMKASFFLNSLPAFSVFLGFGIMRFERIKYIKYVLAFIFSLLFVLVSIHILYIAISIATLYSR